MQARPRPADLPRHERQRDQAAGIVGAVRMLADAHAPEDDRPLGAGIEPCHVANGGGRNAADGFHLLRREGRHFGLEAIEAFSVGLHVLMSTMPSAMITLSMALSRATSRPGLNCSDVARHSAPCPGSARAGSITISLAPRLAAFLRKVAATGWFSAGRAPMTMMQSLSLAAVNGAVTAPEFSTLHQRRNGRGVAQPGAMIDVVGAEALPDKLLEQVGFLVGALGRTEAGNGLAAVARA